MHRKISQARMAALKLEGGARVFVKSRAQPKEPIEKPVQQTPAPEPKDDHIYLLLSDLIKSNQEMMRVIHDKDFSTTIDMQEPEKIKKITVSNIVRNGQNRISSADFDVVYEDE